MYVCMCNVDKLRTSLLGTENFCRQISHQMEAIVYVFVLNVTRGEQEEVELGHFSIY